MRIPKKNSDDLNRMDLGIKQNLPNRKNITKETISTLRELDADGESDSLMIDRNFKQIFSEPRIALWFLKALMPELNINLENTDSLNSYLYWDIDVTKLEEGGLITKFATQLSEGVTGKVSDFDILFDLKHGPNELDIFTINIEMQRKNSHKYNMLARSIYYASKILSNVLNRGEDYNKLHKVYSIWILDFNFYQDDIPIHSTGLNTFYRKSASTITNNKDDRVCIPLEAEADLLEVVFIELKKIDNIHNANQLFDFLKVLKTNEGSLQEKIKALCGIQVKEDATMSRFASFTEELLEEGRAEGRQEGRAEGRAEGKAEVIINMKAKGFTVNQIAEILDMTEENIKQYIDTYSK